MVAKLSSFAWKGSCRVTDMLYLYKVMTPELCLVSWAGVAREVD